MKPFELSSAASDEIDEIVRDIAHAPPRSPGPVPGTRWGAAERFVLERRLGRGGMGTVYAATDTLLGRVVALKVLDADERTDALADRVDLMREAAIAARVEHERIARVYDVGEHQGVLFIAMEFVRGVTLRAWLRSRQLKDDADASGPLPGEVVTIVRQIAEGLAALHRAGIVHRDLKPENVMLGAAGAIKLLDFGLAKTFVLPERASMRFAPALAGAGLSVGPLSGTPGYMAPEQCEGKPVDQRADVFALGVIAYEMVTGVRPFEGEDSREVLEATIRGRATFSAEAWSPFAPAIRATFEAMLARDPNERLADANAVLVALDGWSSSIPPVPSVETTELRALGEAPTMAAIPGATPGPAWRLAATAIVATLTVAVLWAGARIRMQPQDPNPPSPSEGGVASQRGPEGMRAMPGGQFVMGRTSDEADRVCKRWGDRCDSHMRDLLLRETPAHPVTVAPFWIDTFETTNVEFVGWLSTISSRLEEDSDTHQKRYVYDRTTGRFLVDLYEAASDIVLSDDGYAVRKGRDGHPAMQMTWDAANMYCAWRGKRLPSEVEWEYAARGRSGREYPWGDKQPTCDGVIVAREDELPCEKNPHDTAAVEAGEQDVTPEGVHGLCGNVSEWIADTFTAPFYRVDSGCPNCSASSLRMVELEAGDDLRIVRGGSWTNDFHCRVSARGRFKRAGVSSALGVRCAASP